MEQLEKPRIVAARKSQICRRVSEDWDGCPGCGKAAACWIWRGKRKTKWWELFREDFCNDTCVAVWQLRQGDDGSG